MFNCDTIELEDDRKKLKMRTKILVGVGLAIGVIILIIIFIQMEGKVFGGIFMGLGGIILIVMGIKAVKEKELTLNPPEEPGQTTGGEPKTFRGRSATALGWVFILLGIFMGLAIWPMLSAN